LIIAMPFNRRDRGGCTADGAVFLAFDDRAYSTVSNSFSTAA
jgi:hypothetical protein